MISFLTPQRRVGLVAYNNTADSVSLLRYNVLRSDSHRELDRIAHLAQSVFETKIVLIALIDGEEQWHPAKSKYYIP